MTTASFRNFARATVADTKDVKLKGTFLKGSRPDLPTLIWLPEVIEPAANFRPFFDTPRNKILQTRNVWLLDYRNQGESDHHHSYELEEMSDDIVRFMDE
jgi:pimeloyl-ACP methyl ester carboxylesterase